MQKEIDASLMPYKPYYHNIEKQFPDVAEYKQPIVERAFGEKSPAAGYRIFERQQHLRCGIEVKGEKYSIYHPSVGRGYTYIAVDEVAVEPPRKCGNCHRRHKCDEAFDKKLGYDIHLIVEQHCHQYIRGYNSDGYGYKNLHDRFAHGSFPERVGIIAHNNE